MDMMTDNTVSIKEAEILDQAKTLTTLVKEGFENGTAIHKLEKNLFENLLKMGHNLLGLLFELSGTGDVGSSICLDNGREVKQLPELHVKPYLSIFGSFEISRYVYGTREGQKIEYIPLDAHLQLPDSKFSYLLQDWDQLLAVETPYLRVSETISRIFNLTVPVSSLERGNRDMSQSTQSYWDNQVVVPVAEKDQIVVCSADCKGVVIRKSEAEKMAYRREEAENDKPASIEMGSSKKRSGKKKMAVLGAIYTTEAHVRTPDEVLESLFRAPDQPSPLNQPKRAKPICKHVRSSMMRDEDDTLAPARQEIFGWLSEEQQQRNPLNLNQSVLIMDGEESLWSMGKTCLNKESTTEVLDLIHGCSYVWKAVQALNPDDSIRDQRIIVKRYVGKMLCGEMQGVIRSLRWKATHQGLSGDQLKQLEQACCYFANNAHRMCYDEYLAKGYPIASGVIEGACRHVVVDRMEGSGMRWIMSGAQSMLNLRCIHISGHWNKFIDYHIEHEQKKIYPIKAANDESFVAMRIVC